MKTQCTLTHTEPGVLVASPFRTVPLATCGTEVTEDAIDTCPAAASVYLLAEATGAAGAATSVTVYPVEFVAGAESITGTRILVTCAVTLRTLTLAVVAPRTSGTACAFTIVFVTTGRQTGDRTHILTLATMETVLTETVTNARISFTNNT